MIRMKGDIIKQLSFIYPEYSFKNRYKNDFKNRILIFFDQILKEKTMSEILELSKQYCIIENNEIKLFNKEFVETYKTELLNSFNPLWFYNKKEIIKEIEIEKTIDLSNYYLKEILNKCILNRLGSSKVKESIKFFNENLYFTGEEILINNGNEIFKKIYHERINFKKYIEQAKSFKEMKDENKNYNFDSLKQKIFNFLRYLNMLLNNNTYFNIYLLKEINYLFSTRYIKTINGKTDFCLTYVPSKNEFIFLKNIAVSRIVFFKLKETIEEDKIFEQKCFVDLKEEIEEKIIIANEYKKIKNIFNLINNYLLENKQLNNYSIEQDINEIINNNL